MSDWGPTCWIIMPGGRNKQVDLCLIHLVQNEFAQFLWRRRRRAPLRDRFLCRQRSRALLRDHFVRRPSVRLSVCLSVWLSVRPSHFLFAYNFLTLRDRAFIFGLCVPYDKIFSMVLKCWAGYRYHDLWPIFGKL